MSTPEQPTSTFPPETAETHVVDNDVEPHDAVEPGGAVEPDAARRATPPVPTWVWVTIALLAVTLALGLVALAFRGGGGAASSKAVADVRQLLNELTTLNASLATTNSILDNALQNSSEISAKKNAKLEELSANLAGLQASVGQARATMGPQLKQATRKRLANAEAKLQSLTATLAANLGGLSQRLLSTAQETVGSLTTKVDSEIGSRTDSVAALQEQVQALRGDVDRQAAAQARLESALGGVPARIDEVRSDLQDLRRQLAEARVRLQALTRLVQRLRDRINRPGGR